MPAWAIGAFVLTHVVLVVLVVFLWRVIVEQRREIRSMRRVVAAHRDLNAAERRVSDALEQKLSGVVDDPLWDITWRQPKPNPSREVLEAEARNIQLTEGIRADKMSPGLGAIEAHRRLVEENQDIVRTGRVPVTQEEVLGVVNWHLVKQLLGLTLDDETIVSAPMDAWWAHGHRSIVLVSDFAPNGITNVVVHTVRYGGSGYQVIVLGRDDLKRALDGELDIPDDFGNLWTKIHESSRPAAEATSRRARRSGPV